MRKRYSQRLWSSFSLLSCSIGHDEEHSWVEVEEVSNRIARPAKAHFRVTKGYGDGE